MSEKSHYITIKGTKDGLVFVLDDACSFNDLLAELRDKLSADEQLFFDGPLTAVKLKTGNRYLSESQRQQIRDVILTEKNLMVESFEADVVSKAEADDMLREKTVTAMTQMVRSGQSIEVAGDLLLVGDVHSGAFVQATGNIYVMGALKGTAHAGSDGNVEAVIAASVMQPAQLRISDFISRGSEIACTGQDVECAFVHNQEEIIVDLLQSLYRPASGSTTR